jgi:hypothetical protein
MKFEQIQTSKFRPKRAATRTKNNPRMYHPNVLKAAGQHIDTEDLPDHFRKHQKVQRFAERVLSSPNEYQQEV